MSKFIKKCMAIRTLSDTVSRLPYISLLILRFLNCCTCISVKISLINTKLGDFVNLGVLFMTMWINSCLSHIIYRLVASPSLFEIRQFLLEAVEWQLISFVKESFFMKVEMMLQFQKIENFLFLFISVYLYVILP